MSTDPFRPNHLIPGTNYRYIRLLGEGGQGIVVLAGDDFLRTEVVIKLVHAAHASYLSTRVRDEARALAAMKHPGIVHVIGGGMTAEALPRPYFVMERLQGDTLHAVMRRRGEPFAMRSSIDIAIELLDALDVAHNPPHRLLHRDIKPANIFMSRVTPHETRAVLLDFGLAHMFDHASRQTGKRFLGTLEYASPEQLKGEPLTPRSDLYNVGLVLFELLAGRHAFAYCKKDRNAYVHAHIHDVPVRLSTLGVDMDPALDALVHASLQKDPAARPKSAHELASLLRAIRTSADFVRRRPILDGKTEEEPFETLWARMGVTPTTSAVSGPSNPSSQSTVSTPVVRARVADSAPRFETREEAPQKHALGSEREPAIEPPTPTEELPNTRAYRRAMKVFRDADTESSPRRFLVDELSNPPIVLDRVKRTLAKNGLVIGSLVGAAAALVFLALYASSLRSRPPSAVLTSAARASFTATPQEIPPAISVRASAAATSTSVSEPPIAVHTADVATSSTRPAFPIITSATAPMATAPATKPRHPGSGLDEPSAVSRHEDLVVVPP